MDMNIKLKGSNRPNFLKRQYLVLPEFQLRLILWTFGVNIAVFSLVLWQISTAFNRLYRDGIQSGLKADDAFFRIIHDTNLTVNKHLLVGLLLGLLFSGGVMLILSHRMAGPIYRLVTFFESIKKTRRPEKIFFRKGDYLNPYADTINEAIEGLTENSRIKRTQT